MKRFTPLFLLGLACAFGGIQTVLSENPPRFSALQVLTNGEFRLRLSIPTAESLRLESSPDLSNWEGLATVSGGAGTTEFIDSAAPQLSRRFYRDWPPSDGAITGDHLSTTNREVTIHPINHATLVMTWNGKVLYADPVGGAARFTGLPRADLILMTHGHSDHYDSATLNAVKGSNTVLLVPQSVYQSLPAALKTISTVLTNGAATNLLDLEVQAVPAYNLTTSNHPKGVGNGYVLTMGGRRIYISGDTEDIPEMRALPDIDVAFVCMNLPFTMSVDKAADAVLEFRPKVVYPYHYSQSNVNRFKELVRSGDSAIEVRLRKWY